MTIIFIRTLIIFITLVVVLRLMGKRQIGEMQPFEFVITLIIADLACVPMADISIPLLYGIVAILCLFVLHQLLSLLEQTGEKWKLVLSGRPSVVIDKNGVNVKELKKNNMGIDDLIESMRSAGYFSLDDLDYAIFESNGKLSALQKTDIQKEETGLPVVLVNEGKLVVKNIEYIQSNKQNIEDFIKNHSGSVKSTEIMTVNGNGKVYFKRKNQKYEILSLPIKEGVKW